MTCSYFSFFFLFLSLARNTRARCVYVCDVCVLSFHCPLFICFYNSVDGPHLLVGPFVDLDISSILVWAYNAEQTILLDYTLFGSRDLLLLTIRLAWIAVESKACKGDEI